MLAAAPSLLAAPDPGFVVTVEEILPNHQIQAPRRQNHQHGFFNPPDQRNALITTSSVFFFRYRGGVLREVAQHDPVRTQPMEIFNAATVFSQATGTDQLLTVPFDARTKNVSECDHDWLCLGFEHKAAPNGGHYASLACIGEEERLPADVPAWGTLIPPPYRYHRTNNGNPIPSETTCAGLIGSLPLLVALVAFSAQPDKLRNALTTSRSLSGRWVPHHYATGRQSLYLHLP